MTVQISGLFPDFMVQFQFDRAANIRAQRFLLLRRLRPAGIRRVACTYDAYGDSGNWENVTLDGGKIIACDDLVSEIGNFVWDLAYFHHPGFENNEGGYGEVIWDIVEDCITLDHADRFVEVSHSYHEGI